jgi:hypothetical protein
MAASTIGRPKAVVDDEYPVQRRSGSDRLHRQRGCLRSQAAVCSNWCSSPCLAGCCGAIPYPPPGVQALGRKPALILAPATRGRETPNDAPEYTRTMTFCSTLLPINARSVLIGATSLSQRGGL